MKKIYLIADNVDGNRQKYGGGFVDDGVYSHEMIAIDKLSPADDITFLKDASCVLLHKSLEDFFDGKFHDDSHKVARLIRKLSGVGDTIPLALFSDGDTNDLGDYRGQTIFSLSKRAFYGRLEAFVLHFRKTNEVELKILAYGQNYTAYLANRAATSLFVKLQDMQDDERLPAPKVHCEEMEQILSMSQPSIGKTYKEIIIDLTMNPITVREFKNRINNILENIQDYGKNYYTWK